MVVNLFCNTSQFDRGMKRSQQTVQQFSHSTMNTFLRLGRGTMGGLALMAVTKTVHAITQARKELNESEKTTQDYINAWAESVPVFGGASRAIRELAEELSGLAELQKQSKNIDEFIKNVDKLRTDLSRDVQLSSAVGEEKERLQALFKYQDALAKIAEEEKRIDAIKQHNANLDKQINAYKEKQKDRTGYYSGSYNDEIAALESQKLAVPKMPADLARMAKAAYENTQNAINQKKAEEEKAKILEQQKNFMEEINRLGEQTKLAQELKDIPDSLRPAFELLKQLPTLGLGAEQMKEAAEQIRNIIHDLKQIEAENAIKEKAKQMKEYAQSVRDMIKTPYQEYIEQINKLDEAYKKHAITLEERQKAEKMYWDEYKSKIKKPDLGGDSRDINERYMSVKGLAMSSSSLLEAVREQTAEAKKQTEYQRQTAQNTKTSLN